MNRDNLRIGLILRRLLQTDRPVPDRTTAAIEAELAQNYRWNFAVNLLDVANFWFGLSFISSATIVPLFISKLSDSPIPVGLAAVIAQGGWFLPQLFVANFVERLPRRKPMVINLGFFLERLPMWFLVLAALLALRRPTLALVLFLLAYAWHGLGAGLVGPAWQDLIARVFAVEQRGRFLGISLFVGAAAGAISAGFSARLLRDYPFPTNFVYSFSLAALFITASWFFLSLTREPALPVTAPRRSQRQFLAELPTLVRQEHNFRHFLWARLLLALSGMGTGFVTVAAVQRWDVPDSVVGGYTLAFLVGQTAGNLFFGLLADRRGHKLSLELAGLFSFSAFALAWLAPAAGWYFLIFALLGVVTGATVVSGILVLMEFSVAEKRPTYAGLTNTAVGVVSTAGPLLGALLAAADYSLLFAASAFIGLLAFATMRWWVQEPRFWHPAQQSAGKRAQ
ncbi:MAG: MFS transporter [Candidatus Promineifilaceae bacterium]|nr:MFS transporter [Candidatus Promineifilaceae bacterium]